MAMELQIARCTECVCGEKLVKRGSCCRRAAQHKQRLVVLHRTIIAQRLVALRFIYKKAKGMVDAAAPHDALCPNKNIIHSAPSINAIGTSAHLGSAKDQVQTTAALMVGRSQTLYNIKRETKKSRAIYGIYVFLRVLCQEERRACW